MGLMAAQTHGRGGDAMSGTRLLDGIVVNKTIWLPNA
jgi:hypothetical protein